MARYTSERLILAVEDRLLAAALERALMMATADPVRTRPRRRLNESMGGRSTPARWRWPARSCATIGAWWSGWALAGTGKTTAMQLAARALAADGRRLVANRPSARAAAVLGRQIGVPATNAAKLLHAHTGDAEGPAELAVGRGDVVLVDEAGMAGTPASGWLLELGPAAGRCCGWSGIRCSCPRWRPAGRCGY